MKQAKGMKLFIPKNCYRMTEGKKGKEVCIYLYILTLDAAKSCHMVAGNELLYLEV